eukprot:5009664-Pleurochrysis_carterae.AAC.1
MFSCALRGSYMASTSSKKTAVVDGFHGMRGSSCSLASSLSMFILYANQRFLVVTSSRQTI